MIATGSIEHVVIGGGPALLCLWPRHGGIWRWGAELLVGHIESPCAYRHPQEAARDLGGVWKRGYLRLRRSLDGGRTWQEEGRVFDNSQPFEKQRRILALDEYRSPGGPHRETVDTDAPDTILLTGRAWCGEEIPQKKARRSLPFCFRSPDRGRHWESVPSILWPQHSADLVEFANSTLSLGKGRLVCWLVGCRGTEGVDADVCYDGPQLYCSENHGVHWDFYGEICRDREGGVAYSYPHLVPLPSGRWLCFVNAWRRDGRDRTRWTSLCHSDDQGLNWSAPRRIHVWSSAPFPLRLADGRIVLIYMRCAPDPTGLYAIVSEDDGARWSAPLCLRSDALPAGHRGAIDDGYPVAVELDPGRVFAAYGWQHDDQDVPWFGGRGFIGGTFFRLE